MEAGRRQILLQTRLETVENILQMRGRAESDAHND